MDDFSAFQQHVFCQCPTTLDELSLDVVHDHQPDCPYKHADDVSLDHWILLQSSRQRLNYFSQDSHEELIGDYVPSSILKDNNIHKALMKYRKSRLIDGRNQFGGGRNNLLQFREMRDKVIKKAFNGGVHFRIRRFHLVEKSPGSRVRDSTKLRDVLGSLAVVLENVINESKLESKPGDQIQLIINTEKSPAYWGDTGMDHPIATPFFSVHDVNENLIIPFLFRYFEKYEHITIGDQLQIETVLIRSADNVSSDDDENDLHGEILDEINALKRTKGIIQINNKDKMCFARAVLVVHFFNNKNQFTKGTDDYTFALNEYENVRHDSDRPVQTDYAVALCQHAGIKPFELVNRDDMLKVALVLKVLIKIVDFETKTVTTTIGNKSSQEYIYILRRKVFKCGNEMDPNMWKQFSYHFDAITNMKSFIGKRNYCNACDVGYHFKQSHKCLDRLNTWCYSCYNRVCTEIIDSTVCEECGVLCRTNKCIEQHRALNICHIYWCSKCGKRVIKQRTESGMYESYAEVKNRHRCSIKCNLCKREKESIHKCYMLRQSFKDPVRKLMFFDFETDQSSGVHLPIYCFIKWVVIAVKQNQETETEEIIETGEKEFGVHYAVCKEVGDFIISKRFDGFTCIAHNLRGFDGCFIAQYLIENGIKPELIANGLKLTSISIPKYNIRFIDSLNFLQMRLADMPSTLGIDDSMYAKGYFPHFFSSPHTLNYVGPIPAPEFYGCFDMKDKHYSRFMEWYKKQGETIFDFQKELKLYCKQDVEILEAGCIKFRNLMITITKNIEPQPDNLEDANDAIQDRLNQFSTDPSNNDPCEGLIDPSQSDSFDLKGFCDPFAYLTAPGVCSAIYKAKFLKKNSIAQILPSGDEQHRHSLLGCEYMEFLRRTKYPDIQYVLNTQDGKEIQIGQFRVDGFVPSQQRIIEFNGCFWHGCSFGCIKNIHDIQPIRQQSYLTLLEATMKRKITLQNMGYIVDQMWECQWESMKKSDTEIKLITDTIFIKKRLSGRDAFKGGRTETGLLIYDIENGKTGLGLNYVDICSLYPSVNCNAEYPVGHPEIITCNFNLDISNYFGLIQCQVLPPQNLKNGILPEHVNGKLMFPLCRTCAKTQQVKECHHSKEDRSLFGVWVSEELKQAVKYGYKIIRIYCVHHFKRRTKDLFSNYMKTFFKLKLTATKRPDNETEEELESFIKEINQRMDIHISKEDFVSNPGIRLLVKLCLNCLWGRMGMRDAFPSIDLVRTHNELLALTSDSTRKITTIRFLTPSCIAVLSVNNSVDTVNISNNTNIYLAVFTTAHARIRLYELIKKVEDRFVYCDTDSVIFERSPNESENLKTGKFMGDLTSELKPGEYITHFVSGGPKVYAYKTNFNNCCIKIKGFQICKANSAIFSFENLKRVIENYVKRNLDKTSGRVKNESNIDYGTIRQTIYEHHHKNSEKSNAVALEHAISTYNVHKIRRTNTWQLLNLAEQKVYRPVLGKRTVLADYSAIPHGFKKCEETDK